MLIDPRRAKDTATGKNVLLFGLFRCGFLYARINKTIPLLLAIIALPLVRASNESPLLRLERQMAKKLSIELKDTPLVDACQLISSITGMNIIIAPAVRTANPVVTLRVQDMDAGTCLGWIAKLSETHAEVTDDAIFITDKPSKKLEDQERSELMVLGAGAGVVVNLPPDGQPLTDDDRKNVALQIMEKEQMKIQDFPGPVIGLNGVNGVGAEK